MEKLKLHYAKIDLIGDIPMIEFNDMYELISYLLTFFPEEKIDPQDIVYLVNHKNEIFVSQSIDYLLHILEQIHNCSFDFHDDMDYNIFLQEYPSFEEAYEVALYMKEENKLCYSSETKNSPYWKNE